MVARETLDQRSRELDLAAEVDPLPGDEDVVEDHQGLLSAEAGVAHVEVVPLELARVAALSSVDVADPLRVGGRAERDGVVFVARAHGDGRHDEDLVRVAGSSLVRLGAAHDDAVVAPFDDVDVHVRVFLLRRRLAAIALRIGHRAVDDEVVVLDVLDVLREALVVVGAFGLVAVVGHRPHRVQGVHPYAALEARAGLLAQQALHLDLLDQVVGRLVDVGEAIDFLTGEVAGRQHQVLVLGILGQLVRHRHAVEARADDRVVDVVLHPLAEHVDLEVEVGDGLDELPRGLESHTVTPSWCRPVPGAGARRGGSTRAVIRRGGHRGPNRHWHPLDAKHRGPGGRCQSLSAACPIPGLDVYIMAQPDERSERSFRSRSRQLFDPGAASRWRRGPEWVR